MSKVIQTTNVQAQTFGFQNAVTASSGFVSAGVGSESKVCTISGLAVTPSAGTAFNHVQDDVLGQMLLASTNATFGTASAVRYGVIVKQTSGTSCVFTVDQWYTLNGVSTGSTTSCNSGVFYVIVPAAPPFWYCALTDSTSAVTGSGSDTSTGTALGGSEISTNGLARAQFTSITRTVGSTSATMAVTFTYTGSTAQAIGRAAVVNSIVTGTGANGIGNYAYFVDQINSGVAATVSSNGDTFTPTWTLTLG